MRNIYMLLIKLAYLLVESRPTYSTKFLLKTSTNFTVQCKIEKNNLAVKFSPINRIYHLIETALSLFSSYITDDIKTEIFQVINHFNSVRNNRLSFTFQFIQPAIQLYRNIEAEGIYSLSITEKWKNKEYAAFDCSPFHYSV